MTRWKRVVLPPATVAGEGRLHRKEDLGETPVAVTDYVLANGAVAYRDGEDVQVYVAGDATGLGAAKR